MGTGLTQLMLTGILCKFHESPRSDDATWPANNRSEQIFDIIDTAAMVEMSLSISECRELRFHNLNFQRCHPPFYECQNWADIDL